MRITKLERFCMMLMLEPKNGVSRWSAIGTLKTSNPGAFPSILRRDHGIKVTKGDKYRLESMGDAKKLIKLVEFLRTKRKVSRLDENEVFNFLSAFDPAEKVTTNAH